MGMHNNNFEFDFEHHDSDVSDYGVHVRRYPGRLEECESGMPSPEMEMDTFEEENHSIVQTWIEVWDYVGGNRFRGFVADKGGERAMFVFFDQAVIAGDLKAGLMALLELCDLEYFSCSRLVACLDRGTEAFALDALTKNLGWIGFQLTTLIEFSQDDEIMSDRWLFMDMDV
jgi:hypothetical protein